MTGRTGSGTIGIDVDGDVIQVRCTRRGFEVGLHDGRELDGVLRADAWVVLGIASGALTLDEADVRVAGDGDAVRAIVERRPPRTRDHRVRT